MALFLTGFSIKPDGRTPKYVSTWPMQDIRSRHRRVRHIALAFISLGVFVLALLVATELRGCM